MAEMEGGRQREAGFLHLTGWRNEGIKELLRLCFEKSQRDARMNIYERICQRGDL